MTKKYGSAHVSSRPERRGWNKVGGEVFQMAVRLRAFSSLR